MSLLQWKSEFALGVPEVDYEHAELIELVNGCHARIANGAEADEINACLGDLHAGIAAHFALEERVMRRANYAELAAHKADHEKLLDEIRDLMDSYVADPVSGEVRLRERLGDWFARHFATFDARLHRQLPGH